MAIPIKRIPIQLSGLNNKSDEKNSPEGSFVQAQNIFYDKIGRVDRRFAYKNLPINTENSSFSTLIATTSKLKYFLKIGRYKNKTVLLKANSTYGGFSLFDQQKEMPADNIATSISQVKLDSKASFNANSQESSYSETYQNMAYSRNFDLGCIVNIETIKSELNFKIVRGDTTLYSNFTSAGAFISANPVYHTKILAFENTSTGTTGIVYNNITFLIFVHNAFVSAGTTNLQIMKISGYCVAGQEKNVNNFNWGPLIILKRGAAGVTFGSDGVGMANGSMVVEKFDNQNACFMSTSQILISSIIYYGYIETFNVSTTVDDSVPTSILQNTTYNMYSQQPIPLAFSGSKNIALMALKNITNPSDSFYTLAFACTGASQVANSTTDVIKLINYHVSFGSFVPTVFQYRSSAKIFTDVDENGIHYVPLVVNMAFGNYPLNDTVNRNYNINPMLYVTTNVSHRRTFGDAVQRLENGATSVPNRINAFECTPGVALSDAAILQNHTLSSEVVSLNNNDYFVSSFNDVYQSSYFLCAYNRITLKFSVLSQFFYQNAGLTHNYPIGPNLINVNYNNNVDGAGLAYGYMYGHYTKNVNYGWVTNLIMKDQNLPLSALSGKDLIMAAGYRDNFYKPAQSPALASIALTNPYRPSGQSYYGLSTYDGYVSACSSRLVVIDIRYSKSKELNFNNNKYATGGYLSTYDGNNLNRHGFSTYPVILSNPTDSVFHDPIGEPPSGSFPLYNGFVVTSASPNVIRLNLTPLADGTFPIKAGDAFRLAVGFPTAGATALPSTMTVDPGFFFNNPSFFAADQKVSTEMVVAQVNPNYTGATLNYVDVYVADLPSTGTGAVAGSINLILANYGALLKKKLYNFVAVYRYYDNNNNNVLSAPSLPWGYNFNLRGDVNKEMNGTEYMDVVVSNYVQPNQPYKVVIELYRTIGDSLNPVYYRCGTYDSTSSNNPIKPDFVTIRTYLTDLQLVKQQQLYTNGGELENIPVSNPFTLTTKDNRVYTVQGEDKNTIWYSKRLIPGEEVSFNDALTKNIITKGGDILNICAMDEKIVIFKADSIYYFSGDGANATGQNEQFSDVQIVYNNLGLDPNFIHCVTLIDQGIVFKSSKGLYLIPRGLGELQYIGAGIEDQVRAGILFTRVIGNNKRNEIKIGITSATSSSIYTFNFEQNLWYSEFMAQTVLDLETDADGTYALLNYNSFVKDSITYLMNNPLKQEDMGGAKDFDDLSCGQNLAVFVPVVPSLIQYRYQEILQTNWINFNGIQNFGRLKRLFLLGQNLSGDLSLRISVEYDYITDGSNKEVHSWTESATANTPLQVEIHLARQKCQTIRITIESIIGAANIFNISNVLAEVGMKPKLPLPAGRIK